MRRSARTEKVRSFTVGFVPHMIVCGLMMALLLKQPDLGTAVILGMATLLLLFVAGAKISYILVAFLAAAPVVYQAITEAVARYAGEELTGLSCIARGADSIFAQAVLDLGGSLTGRPRRRQAVASLS